MDLLIKSGLSENTLVNLLGFQLAWWSAVLFMDQAWPLLVALLVLHLCLHRQPGQEAKVLVLVALLGYTIDSLLTRIGVFQFATGASLPPLWLALLWLCFAATLRQGLSWFNRRLILAAIAAGIAGSSSYLAGAQFGAVSLGLPFLQSAIILAIIWSLLFPALLVLTMMLSGAPLAEEGSQ